MALNVDALTLLGRNPFPSLDAPRPLPPVRYVVPLVLGVVLAACSPDPSGDGSPDRTRPRADTLSHHANGMPQTVTIRQGDSVLERRTYRPTGTLLRVTAAGSTQTYFDLHDPDSAAILQDYLHGQWRNLSADTSREQSSAYYIFDGDRLTFETPSRTPLESLRVEYKNDRTLVTKEGMSVRPEIVSFDTVRVTGYTLVRLPPPDSL